MCWNGDNPAMNAGAAITRCPHVESAQRVNFCGCCFHEMCDMCAAMHPMLQNGAVPMPCHLGTRAILFAREKALDEQIVKGFHSAPPVKEEPTEYHIDTIV